MRLLIVAATEPEIAPLAARLRVREATARPAAGAFGGHAVDVLITGVGMVATAARTAHALSRQRYDLAFNFGVGGSFDPALHRRQVVHVVSDRLAELGAQDGDQFLTAQQLKLVGSEEFPFSGGLLVNPAPPDSEALRGLPEVSAITVSTVHGDETAIAEVRARFNPQIESMEGAAFMYACLIAGVPFAQVRAISNAVERRNRAAWDLEGAIESLGQSAVAILNTL